MYSRPVAVIRHSGDNEVQLYWDGNRRWLFISGRIKLNHQADIHRYLHRRPHQYHHKNLVIYWFFCCPVHLAAVKTAYGRVIFVIRVKWTLSCPINNNIDAKDCEYFGFRTWKGTVSKLHTRFLNSHKIIIWKRKGPFYPLFHSASCHNNAYSISM